MKLNKHKTLIALGLGCLALYGVSAKAQSAAAAWPTMPIHFTVPATAGSAPDIMVRLLGEKLAHQLGATVVIENRPGAGGTVGMASVKHSTRKDHHFVFAPASSYSLAPFLYPKTQVDIVQDFIPVALVAKGPMMIAVKADSPIDTISDLIEVARKQSDIVISTTSQFTAPHLTADILAKEANITVRAIPYSASAASIGAVVNGDAIAVIDGIPPLESMVQGGRLKALAVFSDERLPNRQHIPTVRETLDYPSLVVNGWFAVAAPAGTNPAAIEKVSASLKSIVNEPDVQAVFDTLGVYASPSSPAEFGTFWSDERTRWSKVLDDVGAPVVNR